MEDKYGYRVTVDRDGTIRTYYNTEPMTRDKAYDMAKLTVARSCKTENVKLVSAVVFREVIECEA